MAKETQTGTLQIVDNQIVPMVGHRPAWEDACALFPTLPGLHEWLHSEPQAKTAYKTAVRKNYVPEQLSACLDDYGATDTPAISEQAAARSLSDEALKTKDFGDYVTTSVAHRYIPPRIIKEIIKNCGERQISPIFEDNLYDRWTKYLEACEQEKLLEKLNTRKLGPNKYSKLVDEFSTYTKTKAPLFFSAWVMFAQGHGMRNRAPGLVQASQRYVASYFRAVETEMSNHTQTLQSAIEQSKEVITVIGKQSVNNFVFAYRERRGTNESHPVLITSIAKALMKREEKELADTTQTILA